MKTYLVDTDIMNYERGDTCHYARAKTGEAAIIKVRYRLLGRRGYYHNTQYWTAKEVA